MRKQGIFYGFTFSAAAALLLSACGGGGGDGESAPVNNAPEIISFTTSKTSIEPGEALTLRAEANDPDGDSVSYSWTASSGTISDMNPTNPVLYTSESTCQLVQVLLTVSDGQKVTQQSQVIRVLGGVDCGNDFGSSSSNNNQNPGNGGSDSSSTSSNDSDSSSSDNGGGSNSSSTSSNGSDSSSSDNGGSDSSSTSSNGSDSSSSQPPTNNPYLSPSDFGTVPEADRNSTYVSDITAEVAGLETSAIATLNNAQARVNGEVKTDSSFTVQNGDMIELVVTTGDLWYKDYVGSIEINGYASNFTVQTKFKEIKTPEDFSFESIEQAELSSEYTSNEITVSGITVPVEASVDNGEIILNGDPTGQSAEVERGDRIQLQLDSAGDYETTTSTALTIWNKQSSFDITTKHSKVQIMLEDQRFYHNQEVDIDINDYITSEYDNFSCSIEGSVPEGLSMNQLYCTITGTADVLGATGTVTVTANAPGLEKAIVKEIAMEVGEYESEVYKTGQTRSYAPGDDGNYSSRLGEPLEYVDKSIAGYIEDENTKLQWQDSGITTMEYDEAYSYCEELELAGYNGWRVPTIEELETINNPEVPFHSNKQGFYWSQTPYAGDSAQRWYIDSSDPYRSYHVNPELTDGYVRCVRGGEQ